MELELNSTPIHLNTCGLGWIQQHLNNAIGIWKEGKSCEVLWIHLVPVLIQCHDVCKQYFYFYFLAKQNKYNWIIWNWIWSIERVHFSWSRKIFFSIIQHRWLSPTDDPYGHPNPKWILDGIVSASNRVPICETHFGLQQRHNSNMSILSPEDSFAGRVLFWVLLLEKTKIGYWTLCL
jgi:hypothetical protein